MTDVEFVTRRFLSIFGSSASFVPDQEFVVRQDTACGSTIGPLVSSQLAVRAVGMFGVFQ